MFAAINKKKQIVATGQSKSQIRRKLCKMGRNFPYTIIEIEEQQENICPVCGTKLKFNNKSLSLIQEKPTNCFFCECGIRLNKKSSI